MMLSSDPSLSHHTKALTTHVLSSPTSALHLILRDLLNHNAKNFNGSLSSSLSSATLLLQKQDDTTEIYGLSSPTSAPQMVILRELFGGGKYCGISSSLASDSVTIKKDIVGGCKKDGPHPDNIQKRWQLMFVVVSLGSLIYIVTTMVS